MSEHRTIAELQVAADKLREYIAGFPPKTYRRALQFIVPRHNEPEMTAEEFELVRGINVLTRLADQMEGRRAELYRRQAGRRLDMLRVHIADQDRFLLVLRHHCRLPQQRAADLLNWR